MRSLACSPACNTSASLADSEYLEKTSAGTRNRHKKFKCWIKHAAAVSAALNAEQKKKTIVYKTAFATTTTATTKATYKDNNK